MGLVAFWVLSCFGFCSGGLIVGMYCCFPWFWVGSSCDFMVVFSMVWVASCVERVFLLGCMVWCLLIRHMVSIFLGGDTMPVFREGLM